MTEDPPHLNVDIAPAPSAPRGRRRRSLSAAWLFAIALFGYPIVGEIVSFLQIDSRVLSIPFRVGVALFSLWVILWSGRLKIDRLRVVMVVIWFFYFVRLTHDWMISNLEGADYAFQFFLASCVLPATALMKARAYQQRQFAWTGFVVAGAGAIISLLGALLGNSEVESMSDANGRLTLTALDPVSLGHLAVSALLCAVVLWKRSNATIKTLLLAAMPLLLWCLVLTGSKGPALALIICLGLWAVRRHLTVRIAILATPLVLWLLISDSNPLAARLAGSEDDQSTTDRIVILSDSINQIAGSPIFGSAFVELNSGYYPHNIFVESGLDFGIPGALIFLAMVLVGLNRAWKSLNRSDDLLGLIFIQGVLAGAISGALFAAAPLWVALALLPESASIRRLERKQSLLHQPVSTHLPEAN